MRRTLATIALAIAGLSKFNSAAEADTIVVPLGGDIQAAIDSASEGDTIQLEAGTYGIFETLVMLGRERTLGRIARCLESLEAARDSQSAGG